jgi:hypothetical protein
LILRSRSFFRRYHERPLKGDPLSDQPHARAGSVDALSVIYQASADTQVRIASALRDQADVVAHGAIERLHAGSEGIVAQLTPRLVATVERTTHAQVQNTRMHLFAGGGVVLAIDLVVAGVYAVGFASGRIHGEFSQVSSTTHSG